MSVAGQPHTNDHFSTDPPNSRAANAWIPKASRRLDEHMLRALKIKRPSTAEEITELLNRDLDPGDRRFETREVATWLRGAHDQVLSLYWLQTRSRR